MFVLKKKNHHDGQSSRPRLQWTFPQKTVSLPTSDGVRQLFTDGDYLIM